MTQQTPKSIVVQSSVETLYSWFTALVSDLVSQPCLVCGEGPLYFQWMGSEKNDDGSKSFVTSMACNDCGQVHRYSVAGGVQMIDLEQQQPKETSDVAPY